LAHAALALAVVGLGFAPGAAAASDALRGVARFVVAVGVPRASDPPGSPCDVAQPAQERAVVEALHAAGAEEVWGLNQALAMHARSVERREEINRLLREGRPLPPDINVQSRERLAALQEVTARPTVAVSLIARAAVAPTGEVVTPLVCAVSAQVSVHGNMAPDRTVALGATGREVRRPLMLWEGSVKMFLLPPGPGHPEAVRAEVAVLVGEFIEAWRSQNRGSN
jgi:hypothetical protein